MVKFDASTDIKRPVEEVFAYVTDAEKVPEWNALVLESKASPPGPLRVGSKILSVTKILGRRIESTAEVTEFVPNEKYTWTGSSPFPTELTTSVESLAGGTKVTVSGHFEPGGFFKLGEPILGRIIKKQGQAQLDTLKEILEARAPSEVGS